MIYMIYIYLCLCEIWDFSGLLFFFEISNHISIKDNEKGKTPCENVELALTSGLFWLNEIQQWKA